MHSYTIKPSSCILARIPCLTRRMLSHSFSARFCRPYSVEPLVTPCVEQMAGDLEEATVNCVDAWISKLLDGKTLAESEVVQLCNKVRLRLSLSSRRPGFSRKYIFHYGLASVCSGLMSHILRIRLALGYQTLPSTPECVVLSHARYVKLGA